MNTPQRILIIRFSSIGDVILTSPLIRTLRASFPDAQIDFLVRKDVAELVRYHPSLNNVYEYDPQTGLKGLRTLKSQLKDRRYDLVIDAHNSLRSRYIRLLLSREIRKIRKRIFARTMLVKFKKNYYSEYVSVADRYIEPVHKFGIKNDTKGLDIFIPEEIKKRVAALQKHFGLKEHHKCIGISAFAKHTTKCWPAERFVELAVRLIQEHQSRIILFGSIADQLGCTEMQKKIAGVTGNESVINVSGHLSLLESAAMVKICSLMISNDSGFMHVASAMKVPLVAIFGSTVKEFGFYPHGQNNVVIEKSNLKCRPCSHIGRNVCPEGHFRCMLDIQVHEVLTAASLVVQ